MLFKSDSTWSNVLGKSQSFHWRGHEMRACCNQVAPINNFCIPSWGKFKVQLFIYIKTSHFLWKMNNKIYQCFLPNKEEKHTIKLKIISIFHLIKKSNSCKLYQSFYLVCANPNLVVSSNSIAFSGEPIRERGQRSGKGLEVFISGERVA